MKKRIIYFAKIFAIILLLFAGVFALPQQKAQAYSVPLALQGAAGVYVIGGLLVAAGAGAVGYDEYGEEIKAHSLRAWDNATQLSKDAMDLMVDAATTAGTSTVAIGSDVATFLEGQLDGLANWVANVRTANSEGGAWNSSVSSGKQRIFNFTSNNLGGKQIFVSGQEATRAVMSVGNGFSYIEYTLLKNGETVTTRKQLNLSMKQQAVVHEYMLETGSNLRRAINFASSFGLSVQVGPDVLANYNNARANVQEQWQIMRDAGLVLPVDEFVPMSADGQPLTYNPATGALTGIDGGVYTGDYTWQIPNVKWREQSDAVPKTGVWVETPVMTGNPAYDGAITQAPTITEITTGTTVANPDIAIEVPEGGVPNTGDPTPGDGAACTRKMKFPEFEPLQKSMSENFPFSVPYDIKNALNAGFGDIGTEKPLFVFNLPVVNKTERIEIRLPDFFDDWKPFTDSLLLFVFDIGIMYGIYRLIKGGG